MESSYVYTLLPCLLGMEVGFGRAQTEEVTTVLSHHLRSGNPVPVCFLPAAAELLCVAKALQSSQHPAHSRECSANTLEGRRKTGCGQGCFPQSWATLSIPPGAGGCLLVNTEAHTSGWFRPGGHTDL